ncbi:uncharacterized protein PGTG_19548 [Puccinia graminis f. sp. tritici CRL 75-36-700-3]|uniref:Uncharacterized protein n=1 Tax=Puccinia graminis f. sp. tritici (strain CRL 75-36-700-3 / race SCCL) TaxID=418459 RepID=E3LAH7_PUCGT|nr:uncharacterized protein PGTG_19548 [Puccinia graminis f. sp. tritici CRL 75-36-700-3]EFP93552.2 hypothetical protein PGTG_19548 [Puccinia graminis f. sp. tritici CRL 75-36-700-3]
MAPLSNPERSLGRSDPGPERGRGLHSVVAGDIVDPADVPKSFASRAADNIHSYNTRSPPVTMKAARSFANFDAVESPDGVKYVCLICPKSRPIRDPRRHSSRQVHQINVARAREAARMQADSGRMDASGSWVDPYVASATTEAAYQQDQEETVREGRCQDEARNERLWQALQSDLDSTLLVRPGPPRPTLAEALNLQAANGNSSLEYETLDALGSGHIGDAHTVVNSDEEAASDQEGATSEEEDVDAGLSNGGRATWFPFKNKMDLVASLLIGHTRSMLSRSIFTKLRDILTLTDLQLPNWATVRSSRARIRRLLGSEINTCVSVFDTPCFSLSAKQLIAQDLANPLVSSHLDFYPERTDGVNISKFSQSQKWLKDLPTHLRTQMCDSNGKHFYIFEPVQLYSKAVVVPIYFCNYGSKLYVKALEIHSDHVTYDRTSCKITIPSGLEFDDPSLLMVCVDEFDLMYSEILMGDKRPLTEACGESDGVVEKMICLPNKWRLKSGNRVMRTVPITLYADDTSGNTSKQFNKHISFFFTLLGLPPNVANQEYNCHFLSTSNIASVLELSEQIVTELNEMSLDGFLAYDASIHQEVWVNTLVLCFLADSPMHAEVTNTPNPGQSLNPCRMCTLACVKKKSKSTEGYVQKFLERDVDGDHVGSFLVCRARVYKLTLCCWLSSGQCKNPARNWFRTRADTHDLYSIATTVNMSQFNKQSLLLGVKDALNTRVILQSKSDPGFKERIGLLHSTSPDRLYNSFLRLEGFDGVKDTPVEVLHFVLLGIVKYLARDFVSDLSEEQKNEMISRLESFDTSSLNIDSLKPRYLVRHILSLVGKDFKILLQVAPFVFYKHMSPEKKEIWIALCRLTSYIFQTNISNLTVYVAELKSCIEQFLYHLITVTAQWINKPKIHMLLHLVESIIRFGPASLCSTKKFESYNGVLRQGSVHSNKHAPGRDLAMAFDSYASLKFIVSGGWIYDATTGSRSRASVEVTSVFTEHPTVQRAMGYNHSVICPPQPGCFPGCNIRKVALDHVEPEPPTVSQVAGSCPRFQRGEIKISKNDSIGRGSFVVLTSQDETHLVGMIRSLWEVLGPNGSVFLVDVVGYNLGGVDDHYNMRSIHRTRNVFTVWNCSS